MKVLFEYSDGCQKHINQDVYGYTQNIFWVIDGATDIFNSNLLSSSGDVYWVVQQLNRALHNGNTSVSLKEYVRSAISEVRDHAIALAPTIMEIPENQLPTYSICCVRYNEGFLEYLFLGDCSFFSSSFPSVRYTDERIYPFHIQVNQVKECFINDLDRYHAEVLKKVREIKQYINVEHGYWIGTMNPDIVGHAICGKLRVSLGERIVLCSDGFRPNIDEANLVSFMPSDIFNLQKLRQIIDQQNASEVDYLSRVGIDISDDKTILLLEV